MLLRSVIGREVWFPIARMWEPVIVTVNAKPHFARRWLPRSRVHRILA